jgi:septum site-determining protein MinD
LEAESRQVRGLIINRLRPDLVQRDEMLSPDQILNTLSVELLGIVPEAEEVLIAIGKGTPAAHDERSVPGRAYQNIARRLLGEHVPIMPSLQGRRGLLERIGLVRRSGRR